MIQATLHQLKVFETTARLGSFTKAAEELDITQPTVSSQVKQLTKSVGLPLFEQIGKQLYLTEAGKALFTSCQDVFTELDNFEMKIADFKGTKEGKLRLSVITTAAYFIPRILGSFCQIYPDIDVTLQVINHQQIQQRMLNNQDDLYIMSQPPEEIDLKSKPFIKNPLVVIARKDHPLAKEKQVLLEKLQFYPFIMREYGSGTRKAVQNLFNQYDLTVKVRLELGSNEAIKQAILGGLGISVLSKHTLTSACHEDLTILNVEKFPISRYWYISHLAGKQLSVVAKTFLDFLMDRTLLMKV
ncbi:MAG: LysR family transcriptional regulator [Cyanobacteria bacterium]|nr:LysR family transcriptional regulator [Cyanobacteria bacterium CG_2015-16_32_12]NCO76984.1 LysR family transcriptional regulator [Cyanobacteria bacterium CG_2015-22_32_23]NCQ03670.1 LysR family transcriptional regulator [Cyanobacteria bacterium CG_2015-09_32_10]NCQ40922.1 LysR family transcriptional regulator [Cyanobacteria bacterium CG_2015-04_32_10]NCS85177.1 LysR family transcriptional regulator [Cyanobacteria bacterium CG_2015-02_32_10]